MIRLVTGTVTKPWLWGIMSPTIQTCKNLCSYFLENMRIQALKSLDLIWFLSILSIHFNFVRCWGPLWYYHIRRFSVHNRQIEKSMYSSVFSNLFVLLPPLQLRKSQRPPSPKSIFTFTHLCNETFKLKNFKLFIEIHCCKIDGTNKKTQ